MPASKRADKYGPPNKVLLVEGADDQHMVWNLLESHGIDQGLRVVDSEGYQNIRSGLDTRIKLGNQTHLGIIVDADADFQGRWQSIRDVIIRSDYKNVPALPDADGTILQEGSKPTIGIWIMPDNKSHGMLEDFARLLLPPEDLLWQRATAAVAAIPVEERLFLDIHDSKARIHTWLAWQKEPGKPIGQAIKIGYLDGKTDVAQRLVNWLKLLFDLRS